MNGKTEISTHAQRITTFDSVRSAGTTEDGQIWVRCTEGPTIPEKIASFAYEHTYSIYVSSTAVYNSLILTPLDEKP